MFIVRIGNLTPLESPIGATESSQAIYRLDPVTDQNAFVPFGTTDHSISFQQMFGRPYGTWFLSPLINQAINRLATFFGLYETSVTQTGYPRTLPRRSERNNPFIVFEELRQGSRKHVRSFSDKLVRETC